jgi:hypothetical protein
MTVPSKAATELARIGVTPTPILAVIDHIRPARPKPDEGVDTNQQIFNSEAAIALDLAFANSKAQDATLVGTDHLLAGVLRCGSDFAKSLLKNLNASDSQLLQKLDGKSGSSDKRETIIKDAIAQLQRQAEVWQSRSKRAKNCANSNELIAKSMVAFPLEKLERMRCHPEFAKLNKTPLASNLD